MSIKNTPVNRYLVIISTLALFFLSCRKELEKEAYTAYVRNDNNGLRKDQFVGDFELSALYETTDYMLLKEFEPDADTKILEQRRKELEQFDHFQFRIKLTGGGNILQYDQDERNNEMTRVNYLSFEAKNDFKIVNGKDTLACQLAHYSRNYNLTPTVDLSLAFDPVDKTKDFTLVYSDTQFNIGKVKFKFREDDFRELPALKR